MSAKASHAYADLVRTLHGWQMSAHGPEVVGVTREAFVLLKRYGDANAVRVGRTPEGAVRAMLNKAKMHAARLALVLHLSGHAAADPDREHPLPSVSEETMRRAVLLAEWFVREAARTSSVLGMETETRTPQDRVLDELPEEFATADFVLTAKAVARLSERGAQSSGLRRVRGQDREGRARPVPRRAEHRRARPVAGNRPRCTVRTFALCALCAL